MERQKGWNTHKSIRNKRYNEDVNHTCKWNPRKKRIKQKQYLKSQMIEIFQKPMKDLKPHSKTGEKQKQGQNLKKSQKEEEDYL